MQKTVFKPVREIRALLEDARRPALFSCSFCAALSGTGGTAGLMRMKPLLEGWGKTVAVSRCVNVCCSEAVMAEAVRNHLEPELPRCDALVMLSCAAGVKTAFLCNPGVPVLTPLDSVGSVSITRRDDPVTRSVCVSCGECVLSFTGGICPVSECPSKKRHGPCSKAPEGGGPCALSPEKECVWGEISRRGNMRALTELGAMRRGKERIRDLLPGEHSAPGYLRKGSGWVMARLPGLSGFAGLLK